MFLNKGMKESKGDEAKRFQYPRNAAKFPSGSGNAFSVGISAVMPKVGVSRRIGQNIRRGVASSWRFIRFGHVTLGKFVPLGKLRATEGWGQIDRLRDASRRVASPVASRDNRPLIAFVMPIINNASIGMARQRVAGELNALTMIIGLW